MTLRKLLGRWAQALYSEDQKRQRLQQKKRRQEILQQRKKAKEAARTLGFADFFFVVSVCVVSPKWKSFSDFPSVVIDFLWYWACIVWDIQGKEFLKRMRDPSLTMEDILGPKIECCCCCLGNVKDILGHSDDVMPSVTCDEA